MRKIILILFVFSTSAIAFMNYTLDEPYEGITSNSVIEIVYDDSTGIWLGTGGGVSYSVDDGQSWLTFGENSGLPRDEVSALAASVYNGTTYVWVANAHTEYQGGSGIPIGDGLSYTIDGGFSWYTDTVRAATWYGMLSYDMDMYQNHIYSACYYGGLIRSVDNGQSWENLYLNADDSSDYVDSTYSSYSNRYFSVMVDLTLESYDTISVWAGSAYGINRFIFTNYDNVSLKQDTALQILYDPTDTTLSEEERLPGNFVVALGVNCPDTVSYIWAACRPGAGYTGQSYGVAYSTNYGMTWTTAFSDSAWDFAFIGDTVIVACSHGLYISDGDYQIWDIIQEIEDSTGQRAFLSSEFYAVEVVGSVIWAGGSDGTVRTADGGTTWSVYRSQLYPEDHYAYPSPFSPYASARKGATIHYRPSRDAYVTIKIYDFNLDLVQTLVENAFREGEIEADIDIWDGKNDKGDVVANGVYFYNIKLDTGEDWWGKVALIK
jgi:hypothetical protein